METEEKKEFHKQWEGWHKHDTRLGKVLGGMVIVAVGAVFLARQMDYIIPEWVFTWPMLLITIGIFKGARHSFRHNGWLVLVIVGSVFLVEKILPGTSITHYLWPILIIGAGLFMIFSPKRKCGPRPWKKWDHHRFHRQKWEERWKQDHNYSTPPSSSEDYIEAVAVFGGVKKNIISKDFKGGEIVCVFGGAEINLSQADINGEVTIEATQVFGGTKLVVPPHWQIQSEVVVFMGAVDDKRSLQKEQSFDPNKKLIIKGNAVFGGLEIKSY